MKTAETVRARYWDRTSDLFRVREARYRCANRAQKGLQVLCGGGDGIRTRVYGFAGRCLASRPPHRNRRIKLRLTDPWKTRSGLYSDLRADDGIRTRDIHLGKVVL